MASRSKIMSWLWCAIVLVVGCFSTSVAAITIKGKETDREALLAIKSQIRHDPLGVTSSWNNSVALCSWEGITCGRKHQRVTMLGFRHKQLTATLSPYVGNLSFLRYIDLGNNSFDGFIPLEIGQLSMLQILVLSYNSFQGTIPANLSHCSTLTWFSANRNNLVGNIPAELGDLLKLEVLYLHFNDLTGLLPTSLGNISTLQRLYLYNNHLQGRVPATLGLLKSQSISRKSPY
ncbi:hypothetical protein COLO4_28974 [Corchorus olitorius]|uniref:Leucine-rich repeat-containing N-terminal plant-type domain-containing protein n=1 Tax=Corchorus olitorius TaxID=93759 RepID=A0A1R3HH47_9ROSI|nr:hypothetical protein COLO4_28974 [Corchorus olitorius]